MRTNIEIDDKLIERAMRSSGTTTKKATVDAALKLLVKVQAQGDMRKFWGKVKWEGNLDESRRD